MLTELQCRSARPGPKPYKLADSLGLYLFVTTKGHRSWRLKFSWKKKAQTLVLGAWPKLTLKAARALRDAARLQLEAGVDPRTAGPGAIAAASSAPTFEAYARSWHADQAPMWKQGHADQVLTSLVNDVFPAIGATAIDAVKPSEVRALLKEVQDRGAIDIAHRVRGRISSVFARAMAEELVESDPAAAIAAVLKPVKARHFPALTKLEEARAFLRAVEAAPAHPATKLASRLLAITAARPGMLRMTPRMGEMTALQGLEPLWEVPADRMKLDRDRAAMGAFDWLVPLPRQAVDVIVVAWRHAGRSPWLFPMTRHAHKPISENALSYAYKRLEVWRGRHVPHGWRSTFSSVMNELAAYEERLGDEDVIELMLAHKPKGVRGIYNRAAYMRRRREIAQEWADMLLAGFPPASSLLDGLRG